MASSLARGVSNLFTLNSIENQAENTRALRGKFKLDKHDKLITDYSCAIKNESGVLLHGRMWIFECNLCFYSNIFGYVTEEVLQTDKVEFCVKSSYMLVPNAIEIHMEDKSVYFFGSLINRDATFYNLARACGFPTPHPRDERVPAPGDKRVRRRKRVKRERGDVTSEDSESNTSRSRISSGEAGSPQLSRAEEKLESPSMNSSLSSPIPEEKRHESRQNLAVEALKSEETSGMGLLKVDDSFRDAEVNIPDFSDMTLEELVKCQLSCSSLDLYKLCYSDDAPFSFATYQAREGDTELNFGKWRQDKEIKGVPPTLIRDNTYMRKIKDPPMFLPDTAFVTEQQRVRCFGKGCVVLDRVVQTPEVIQGDCFQCLLITKAQDIAERKCLVTVSMAVRFVKDTWLESIIRSRATSDTKTGTIGWMEQIKRFLKMRRKGRDKKGRRRGKHKKRVPTRELPTEDPSEEGCFRRFIAISMGAWLFMVKYLLTAGSWLVSSPNSFITILIMLQTLVLSLLYLKISVLEEVLGEMRDERNKLIHQFSNQSYSCPAKT